MSIKKENLSMVNCAPQRFYYYCSFCWRELPHGGVRFAGIGACPIHLRLAEKLVGGLREHALNYFNNLGGVNK